MYIEFSRRNGRNHHEKKHSATKDNRNGNENLPVRGAINRN
jgi:hypothetical protein